MRLEYEIATSGRQAFVRDLKTIDRELDKQARLGVSRESRTERQRVRLREAGIKQRLSAEELAAKKAADAQVRLAKMAEAAKAREEKRAAAEHARQLRWRQNLQNRHYQQLALQRKRDELAEIRSQQRQARAAQTTRARTAARFRAGFGRVASGTAGLIGGGIRMVGATAGIAGGLIAGNAISTQIDEQKAASRLANQAGNPALKGELLKEAQSVKGFTGAEAMAGMSAFVEKTGDLNAARKLMTEMSRVAIGTGTELEDLGRTAGQAFTVLADQVGPQAAIQQTAELMRVLAQQGNMGAVEISDLARDFGKLGAATRSFEGGAPALLRQMGAFAQIAVARGGAEGSADAATASTRLANDMITKRKKFEKILGRGSLQSTTDKTKLRDPLEIMIDLLNKTGGDVMKTGGLFGNESVKIFRGLSATYSAAEAQQKGTGEAAVRKEFERLAGASISDKELDASVQSRMEDPDIQLKESFKKLNRVVGEKLVPEIINIVNKLTANDNISKIGNFVDKVIAFGHQIAPLVESVAGLVGDLVEKDPFNGLGVIVGGLIAKQILAAGVSAAAEQGMAKLMSILAARAAGSAAADVVGDVVGGGAAGKAGKAGKLGKFARVGKFAGAAGLAGLAGAGIAVAGLGIADAIDRDDARVGDAKAARAAGLDRYVTSSGTTAAGDKSLQGSPAAIQAMIQQSLQAGAAPQNEAVAQKQIEAAERQISAANAQERAARSLENSSLRTTPIIRRGG